MPRRCHAGVELLLDRLDALDAALGAHRATQQVGVVAAAVAEGDRHGHQLLLEQRHALGALEHRHQLGVVVGHRLLAGRAPHVGVHRAALDRAGTDQGDLDGEVVELAGPQPGQRADLRPALHLEDADRVGAAEHVVDGRLLLGHRREVPLLAEVLGDEPHHVVERAEHPQPEQVELDQPHRLAGVLVPLQHGAPVHPRPLDGADLPDGSLGQHHPAGVDAEVARGSHQLLGQRDHRGRHVVRVGSPWSPATTDFQPSICLDQASCWPGEKPSALAASRTAIRGR